MSELRFTSGAGARVIVQMADFESAMELHDAVMKEVSELKLDLDFSFLKGMETVGDLAALDAGTVLATITNRLIPSLAKLAASKEVKAGLFKCLARATYNDERISLTTFESAKARPDFYEIMFACLKVNLGPFF